EGWIVPVRNTSQNNGTILVSAATAPTSAAVDRGAGAADIPFAVSTPQAGLVPIRLAWYQGASGGNLEFFTYGANGTKIPVNDRNNPNSVKAYYKVITTPQLRFTSATLSGGTLTIDWTGT